MKNIGIWLDKKNAKIVVLNGKKEVFKTLESEVEFFNRKGGSGPRMKWGGPQDVVHESKYDEREKHQLKAYFKNLVGVIKDADALAIFGPSDTCEKFKFELLEHYKPQGEKIRIVEKADHMTDNQIKAMVKDFFRTGNSQHTFKQNN